MLTAERDTAPVYFMTFMRLKARNPDALICLFEGEDRKYYGVRLDLLLTNVPWHGIDCGGKKNVIDLYNLIRRNESYSESLIAGFVDRDFDDPIDLALRNYIYETPGYSIENFYCSSNCVERILSIEFKLDSCEEKPDLLSSAMADFKRCQHEFHDAVRPFNLWIFAHRRRERQMGNRKLNLNNVGLSQFVRTPAEGARQEIDIRNFGELFPGSYNLTEADLQECAGLLPALDDGSNYRGKYEIEFVRKYLEKLRAQCANKDSELYAPGVSVKLSLSKGNFISEVSQYADTPEDLKNFVSGIAATLRQPDERRVA